MSIHIEARQFTSEAEYREAIKARKLRLYGKPKIVNIKAEIPFLCHSQYVSADFDQCNDVDAYIRDRAIAAGVTQMAVVGKTRIGKITALRAALMLECREKFGLSYPALGRKFHRHHTSVMAAVRRERKIQAMKDAGEIE